MGQRPEEKKALEGLRVAAKWSGLEVTPSHLIKIHWLELATWPRPNIRGPGHVILHLPSLTTSDTLGHISKLQSWNSWLELSTRHDFSEEVELTGLCISGYKVHLGAPGGWRSMEYLGYSLLCKALALVGYPILPPEDIRVPDSPGIIDPLTHHFGVLQTGENMETYWVLWTLPGPGALAFWVGENQIPGPGEGP